jgi:hypothetical protein
LRIIIWFASLLLVFYFFECLDESQMVLDALLRRTRPFKRVLNRIKFDFGILEDVCSASLA